MSATTQSEGHRPRKLGLGGERAARYPLLLMCHVRVVLGVGATLDALDAALDVGPHVTDPKHETIEQRTNPDAEIEPVADLLWRPSVFLQHLGNHGLMVGRLAPGIVAVCGSA